MSTLARMRCALVAAASAIVVVGIGASPAPAWPASGCTVRAPADLGTLPGDANSEAAGVNNRGAVVGMSMTTPTGPGTAVSRPVRWTRDQVLDLGSLGGIAGRANAIDDFGDVVGWSWTPSQETHAFRWRRGTMTDLSPAGQAQATGINNAGDVVGFGLVLSGEFHALLWPRGGGMRDLGTLGGANSIAAGVNDRGQIVGMATTADEVQHAFVWQDGTMSRLPDLAGGTATATAINNRGEIVGGSSDGQGNAHAVVWRAGTVVDLGTLGGPFSYATAVDDLGRVAGFGRINNEPPVPAGPGVHGLLWRSGAIYDLGDLVGGTGRSEAFGISERGDIVGRSTTASGTFHAVLWRVRPCAAA